MGKAALRKKFLEKRRQLGTAEVENLSTAIANRFFELPLDKINYIHTFYPIAGRAEVDTLRISERLRTDFPHIKQVLSKSDTQNHTLSHILWDENTPLAMNEWGITEPVSGVEVLPEQLDIVLIPLLVYDKKGNRVGYGKGFYDRFLSECRSDAMKVGLSFFEPVDLISDANELDIPLDACISPKGIFTFKK